MLRKKIFQSEKLIYRLAIILAGMWVLMGVVYLLSQTEAVQATSGELSLATTRYPGINGTRIDSCSLCHTSSIPSLNSYGSDYASNGRNSAALGVIENQDSDGDGFTNIQELTALTFPGNAADPPVVAATPTNTSPPPSATPTNPVVPPSATPTTPVVPPSATATNPVVPPPATPTNPVDPPASTPTNPVVPPTATPTASAVPPSATPTTTGVAPNPTATATTLPPTGVDLDIQNFMVSEEIELEQNKPIEIRLDVKNRSQVNGSARATVTGVQNGKEVYRKTITVSDPPDEGNTRHNFPKYTPTKTGEILWTAVIIDDNSDNDDASGKTKVEDDDKDDDDDRDDDDRDDDDDDDDDKDKHKGDDDDDDDDGDDDDDDGDDDDNDD